jgi:hypothetical protein
VFEEVSSYVDPEGNGFIVSRCTQAFDIYEVGDIQLDIDQGEDSGGSVMNNREIALLVAALVTALDRTGHAMHVTASVE